MSEPDKPAPRTQREILAIYFGLAVDPDAPPVDPEFVRSRRIAAVIFLLIIVLLVALVAF